jgi:hypothetical protein
VEANPDAIGLKIAIVYRVDMDTKELFYQRFVAKNDSVCNISEVNDEEISYYGEGIQLQTKSKLKESDLIALEIANDAVLNRVSKKGKKVSHEINDPKAKGTTAAKGTNPIANTNIANKPEVSKAVDTNITIPTNAPPSVVNEVKPITSTNSVLDQFKKPTKVDANNNNNNNNNNSNVTKGNSNDNKDAKTNSPTKEVSSRPSTTTIDASNKSEQKLDKNNTLIEKKASKKGTKKSSDDTSSQTTNKTSKDKKDAAVAKKKEDNESMLPDFSGITSSLNALKEKAKNKLDSTTNALGLTSKPIEVKKEVADVKNNKTEETFESELRRNKDEQNKVNIVSNTNNNNYDEVSEEVTFGGNATNNDSSNDVDEEQEAIASLSLLTGAKNLFSKMVNRKEEKKNAVVANNTIEKKPVEQVISGINNPEGYLVPQLKRRPILKEFNTYDMERYDPHSIPDIQQDNVTDQNKCNPGCIIN